MALVLFAKHHLWNCTQKQILWLLEGLMPGKQTKHFRFRYLSIEITMFTLCIPLKVQWHCATKDKGLSCIATLKWMGTAWWAGRWHFSFHGKMKITSFYKYTLVEEAPSFYWERATKVLWQTHTEMLYRCFVCQQLLFPWGWKPSGLQLIKIPAM